MYDFIDTMEVQNNRSLPAEAMSINGVYLENEVEGYRTLYVTGRELPEAEIGEQQIGKADGTEYQSKRFVPRVITVTYQLVSDTPEEFRERFNQMNRILNQEEAKIVFRDEPDKHFIGTKSAGDEVPGGALNVSGSFQFYCTDPYKYATTEKTFQASAGSNGVLEATIVNNGAGAVPVDYTITHKHENGYIGIVSEHGVLQLGNVNEVDKEMRKSEVLINHKTPAAMSVMTNNQGILTEVIPMNGSFKTVTVNDKQWLALNSVGTGSAWHGASKMQLLPADSKGEVGARDFCATAKIWFETGNAKQIGLLEFVIGDANGKHLASIHIWKGYTLSNTAAIAFQIAGVQKKRIDFTPDSKSGASSSNGMIYIKKSKDLFEFYFGGKKYQFRVPAAINKEAKSVTIFLGQIADQGSANLVSRMYFNNLSIRKDSEYWYDIPNRYEEDSVVYVDGRKGKVYKNGVISMEDEIIGSKYFYAPPGNTKIQFYYSDFSNPPPVIKAKIREAFL